MARYVKLSESLSPEDLPILVNPDHVALIRPSSCGAKLTMASGEEVYVAEDEKVTRKKLGPYTPDLSLTPR
mgnify:CR=1 FL=1